MKTTTVISKLGILSLLAAAVLVAQVTPQVQMFRNEPKGNIQFRKKGTLDGNLVRTIYQNSGEISDWFDGAVRAPHGEWPKGTGHRSLDGLGLLIGARVKITDATGKVKYITPIESAYREEMDVDPVTRDIWGLEPVPGYVNPSSTKPGINVDKSTFPSQWPRSIFYDLYGTAEDSIKKWDGFWYGYFGRGVSNAQLETYFVIDDAPDKEFANALDRFYPVAGDSARGGLGLRVETRGFQWTHVLAEDIIFWHYDIVNISDNNYDSTVFGFYTDPSVGSVNNDAKFDRQLDMAYAWAPTGKGLPDNYKTGYYGQSFLESPGNGLNGLDDDGDALKTDGTLWKNGAAFNPKMIDERRDDGIDNDEDWQKYTDANNNGKWDSDEPLNDDLGKDGVGVFDPQYQGPDEGEGDGLPTLGEPSFDRTDKDESDQIGLQSAYINILGNKGPTGVWPKNDNIMWGVMTGGFVDTSVTNSNISMVFSSGIFPLKKNQRERFSIAVLFGDDLQDLIFNKVTVQAIYNANYNFAQPPLTPTLSAVPANKKVYLYWDAIAEKSYDRFLKKFDFEGYLLYRSSEPEFQDLKVVTDSKGQGKFWKPIAQWDLVDTVRGPDPVGINGAHFWRGDETGLVNSYIDTTVVNGTKYYYALVSYDMGVVPTKIDPFFGPTGGLTPSECTKIISEDFNGTLKFVDQNCAVVIPNAEAAGYVAAKVDGNLSKLTQGIGTGTMNVGIVNPNLLVEGNTYRVSFDSTGKIPTYKTKSYNIIRTTSAGVTDTVQRGIKVTAASAPVNGFVVTVRNDTSIAIIDTASGWVPGSKTNVLLRINVDRLNAALNAIWPADYEVKFFSTNQDAPPFDDVPTFVMDSVKFTITNTTSGYRCKFLIQDVDLNGKFSLGDTIRIMDGYVDNSNFKLVYNFAYNFRPFTSPVTPTDGDKFVIKTSKPFSGGDYFEFKTHAARMDNTLAKNQMNNISVVPNPYVSAAKWERRSLYQSGRGDRKIDFINLPKECTIKIFTVAGALVKTLEKVPSMTNGAVSWDLISDDGMDVAYGLYENLKTYGNCLLRVDLVPVAGKKFVRISNVDFDNWRWVHTGNDLEKKVAISESWEWDFVNKNRLEIVNHWPYVTDKPNGQKSTVIFGRNRALSRKWYGLPDSIQSLRSQMLELQLMDSLNTGYATDFTGQVFFEFSSKAGLVQSEEPQSNGITASDLQFTSDLRQFYSKDSASKRRVLWRRKHSDVDRTRVTQFTTDGRYKLDEFVSNEAKIKIIRAHNWHEVLLGDSTRGKLGQGKEIPELIKLKTKTNIRKIQNSLGGLLNHALDVAAQFTDKREIVGEFGLGFRDIYRDLFPIEYEQARQIEEDRRVGRFGGSQGGG